MFKKGDHIKTRYDEMKRLDKRWKMDMIIKFVMKELLMESKKENMYICGCGK